MERRLLCSMSNYYIKLQFLSIRCLRFFQVTIFACNILHTLLCNHIIILHKESSEGPPYWLCTFQQIYNVVDSRHHPKVLQDSSPLLRSRNVLFCCSCHASSTDLYSHQTLQSKTRSCLGTKGEESPLRKQFDQQKGDNLKKHYVECSLNSISTSRLVLHILTTRK